MATDTHFFIHINLTLPSKNTTLTLSRRRICKKGLSHDLPLEGVEILAEKTKIVQSNNIPIIGSLIFVFSMTVVISLSLRCFYPICRRKFDEKPL